jgi:hypothetical protein
MKENNLLPHDGEAILIHDSSDDFNRAAVTRTLIGTMPWQVSWTNFEGARRKGAR